MDAAVAVAAVAPVVAGDAAAVAGEGLRRHVGVEAVAAVVVTVAVVASAAVVVVVVAVVVAAVEA